MVNNSSYAIWIYGIIDPDWMVRTILSVLEFWSKRPTNTPVLVLLFNLWRFLSSYSFESNRNTVLPYPLDLFKVLWLYFTFMNNFSYEYSLSNYGIMFHILVLVNENRCIATKNEPIYNWCISLIHPHHSSTYHLLHCTYTFDVLICSPLFKS